MILTFAYTAPAGHITEVQWYHDGVALVDGTYGGTTVSGATTTTLDIENPDASYNGDYYAIVTDLSVPGCAVQTDTITVTAFNCTLAISAQISADICDIEITEQPVGSVSAAVGDTVALDFAYYGFDGPFTVQWTKDSVPLADGPTGSGSTIAGATTTSLSITNSQTTDTGTYAATITDVGGFEGCSATTSDSSVSVTGASVPTATLFWRLDETDPSADRVDQVASVHLTPTTATTPVAVDGQAGLTACVDETGAPHPGLDGGDVISQLAYTLGQDFSMSFWWKFPATPSSGDDGPWLYADMGVGDPNQGEVGVLVTAGTTDTTLKIDAYVENFGGGFSFDDIFIDNYVPATDTWIMVTLVYHGATGLFDLYLDTTLMGTSVTPVTLSTQAGAGNVLLTAVSNGYVPFRLSLVGFWVNYGLTLADITNLYNSGAGLNCCPFA